MGIVAPYWRGIKSSSSSMTGQWKSYSTQCSCVDLHVDSAQKFSCSYNRLNILNLLFVVKLAGRNVHLGKLNNDYLGVENCLA